MRLLLLFGALAAVLFGAAALYGHRVYQAPGPLPADRAVVVPHGGLREVATALQAESVIRSPWQFETAALLTRGQGPLHAAELDFPAAASLRQVLEILRTAKPVQHKLTIAVGLTARQVAAVLAQHPALAGPTPPIQEGTILPQTYAFERGTLRATILQRMSQAMDRALAQAWATRAPDLPLQTPQQALILASIIERETAKPEERPIVAAVYLNRLRLGMKLQSDPTVVYGASDGLGVLDHGLTRAELDADTPYNTYRHAGLPPGPICMPGEASIDAATHPADRDDLYFVADGTGGHVFARTEEEHLRNVARWRAVERARSTP
jgi:UPF0755 protein